LAKQVLNWFPQSSCYGVHVEQTHVSFAALNTTDVSPVQAGPVGQLLLGQTRGDTELSHAFAESLQRFFHTGDQSSALMTINLQTMSSSTVD